MGLENAVSYEHVLVDFELPSQIFHITPVDLGGYAAASGDSNPIHLDREAAQAVGLPDVIAHGMLTMGLAGRVVTDWCGNPGAIEEYSARFVKPVVVCSDSPTEIHVTGKIQQKLPENRVLIDLSVKCQDIKVLAMARVVVKLKASHG